MSVQDITDLKGAEQYFKKRLRFETLLSNLSARFVNLPAGEVDREIRQGLKQIVEFFGAGQCTFNEFSASNNTWRNNIIYTRDGIEPAQNIIFNDSFPWLRMKLRQGKVVRMEKISDLPKEAKFAREYCEKFGVKSFLSIPIFIGGLVIASFTLDSFRSHQNWPSEFIPRLSLMGEIIGNAIVRKRNEESLNKAFLKIKHLKNQLEGEWTYLQEEIKSAHNFNEIIGQSANLKRCLIKVGQIAPTDTTALILGETGTGKELIARSIHNVSKRNKRPMVKVNCAALPSNLIESEMFGHEKGAFSGAVTQKKGRFELADGTTLFLDEIGELSHEVQAKMLRVIQDGEFERLGSSSTLKVDVRIIAATNRNLKKEMEAGKFREDLWYRLNVFPITVPPLRERKEDIPLLIDWFAKTLSKKLGKKLRKIPSNLKNALYNYSWPGNIRELKNVIERAIIISQSPVPNLAEELEIPINKDFAGIQSKKLDEIEREHIIQILEETKGRIDGPKGAAKILGMNPSTLRSRLRKFHIQASSFRK